MLRDGRGGSHRASGRGPARAWPALGRRQRTFAAVGGKSHKPRHLPAAYRLVQFFPFYTHSFEFLFDANLELLHTVLKILKTAKTFEFTATYSPAYADKADYRLKCNTEKALQLPRYYQVFDERNGFISNLSCLDLIFHLGPQAKDYLLALK